MPLNTDETRLFTILNKQKRSGETFSQSDQSAFDSLSKESQVAPKLDKITSKFSIENIPRFTEDDKKLLEILEKEQLQLERQSQRTGFETSPDLSSEDFNILSDLKAKENLQGVRTSIEAFQAPVKEDFKERTRRQIIDTLSPLKRVFEIQTEESLAGLELAGEAIKGLRPKPRAKPVTFEDLEISAEQIIEAQREKVVNIGKLGLGSLQFGLSPLTGIERGIFGEPVGNAARAAGIPEFIAQMMEDAAAIAPSFLVPSLLIGRLRTGRLPLKEISLDPKVVRRNQIEALTKQQKDFDKNVPEGLRDLVEGRKGVFAKPLGIDLFEDITKAAALRLQETEKGLTESRRIFLRITDKLIGGEIDVENLPKILKNNNLSLEEFGLIFQLSASFAGKTLNRLSQVSKQLKRVFADNPEAVRVFEQVSAGVEKTTGDKILASLRHFEDFRRSLLVTQLATAMRNAWSQLGRISLSAFDEVLQGTLTGVARGNLMQEVRQGLNSFFAMFNRLSPSGRKRLLDILEKNSDVVESSRLLSQTVHEVIITNKISKVLNTLNRAQEYFFRKLAFEAKLRQLLARNKLNYDTVDPKKIPEDLIAQSVDYALEMTFAATPKAKWLKSLIRGWRKTIIGTTINPFPRFAFGNALPFMFEHSPLGYLKAMSPKSLEALASGNPEIFAKAASRAMIGNLMFLSAWHLRQSKFAGEKGYQLILNPDRAEGEPARIVDTRAFAPLTTYLQITEMFINPQTITPADMFQMAIGLNRMSGSGLVLADLLRPGMTNEGALGVIQRFTGQLIGSFTVPFRQFKDFADAIPPEETTFRDSREDPILSPYIERLPFLDAIINGRITAPTLSNIPIVSQRLQENIIPTRVSGEKQVRVNVFGLDIPVSIFRQLTGFTIFEKNVIEQELDKINFPRFTIKPRTGIVEADNEIARIMISGTPKTLGVFEIVPRVIKSFNYKTLSTPEKRLVMRRIFQQIREEAKHELIQRNPFLMTKVRINQRSRDEKLVLEAQIEQATPQVRQVLESVGVAIQ